MKIRVVFIFFVGVGLFCSLVMGDYVDSPDWEGRYDFTHQSWDFGKDEGFEPVLPALPDGEPDWLNPFYDWQVHDYDGPRLTSVWFSTFMAYWVHSYPDFSTYRTGLYGGMADTSLTFYVPNRLSRRYWKKYLWVQMAYFARQDGAKNYDISLSRDEAFTDVNGIVTISELVEEVNEPPGDIGRWYRLTGVYKFIDQPQQEYVQLSALQLPASAEHPVGGAAMVDSVDIDTICVNPGDIDADGVVGFSDFAFFADDWQRTGDYLQGDIDSNSVVDSHDLYVFMLNWLDSALK